MIPSKRKTYKKLIINKLIDFSERRPLGFSGEQYSWSSVRNTPWYSMKEEFMIFPSKKILKVLYERHLFFLCEK